MRKLTSIIALISTVMFLSDAFANRESGGRESARAVFVEFNSFGAGIDQSTKQFTDSLVEMAVANDEVVDLEVQQRGREGETYYCVHFKESVQRYAFIANLAKPIVHDTQNHGKRTSVFLGMSCEDRDSATEQDLRAYLRR